MLNLTDPAFVPFEPLAPFTDRLRLAVAAHLQFKAVLHRAPGSH